ISVGLHRELEAIAPVKTDEPLSRHTTLHVGGPADLFLTVSEIEQLSRAVNLARKAQMPTFILGAGSNILVSDKGFRGLVIQNRCEASKIDDEARATTSSGDPATLLRAESGVSMP